MRVLHVYRTYFPDPPGGLQEAIRQIALATAPAGVESRIFTLSPHPLPARIERPEGLVIRSRSWAAPASCDLGGLQAFRRFAELARWANVIHYHFPWPFADLLHLALRPGAPAVMTVHSDIVRQNWLNRLYNPLFRRMLAAMAAVVATSPSYAATSSVLRSVQQSGRLRVISLGIVEESYRPYFEAAERVDLAERFGLAPNGYLLFVGVLRYYKGLRTLVEAAAAVDYPVVVVGEGPERARLEAQAARLPNGRVRFLGRVGDADKIALIKGTRALILPSDMRSEAFGMSLAEAAMCGRAMVSCEIGTGTSWVNANGETGIVIAPGTATALADAMRRLIDDDKLARRYGAAARQRYERLFSGLAMGKSYEKLYVQVVRAASRQE